MKISVIYSIIYIERVGMNKNGLILQKGGQTDEEKIHYDVWIARLR